MNRSFNFTDGFLRAPATAIVALLSCSILQAAPTNLATGGTATASSELGTCCGSGTPFFASRAIDGSRDGSDNNFIFHTGGADNPMYWQVDLGGNRYLDRVELFPRTNAAQGTATNFRLIVTDNSNAQVFNRVYLPTNNTLDKGWGTADLRGVLGQTVRLERVVPTDSPPFLTFSEFEVWGQSTPVTPSLTKGQPATGSTPGFGTSVALGNDGNISANYNLPGFEIYHSAAVAVGNSWQVNLPGTREIDRINLYARQDGVTTGMVRVSVLDKNGATVSQQDVNLAGTDLGAMRYDVPITMPAHTFGSAVKVQTLAGDFLAFGEVEAFSSIDPGLGISYAGVVNHDAPSTYYRFQDITTTAADSAPGGTHPGTYTGAATNIAAIAGNGVTFNGTAGNVNSTVAIDPSFTAEIWASSNTPTWNVDGWMASARNPNGFIIHPDPGTKNVTGYVIDSSGNYTAVGTATIDDITKLHHYALTYDHSSGQARLLVDGNVKVTNAISIGRTANASLPLSLGEDPCCGGRYGNGTLDEFALYSGALAPKTLKGHFYSANVLNDVPTTYYKFEEASTASPVADSAVGNGSQIENGAYNGSVALQGATAGNAAHFDGNSWVHADNVPINDSFTAEVWGRADTDAFTAYGWLASARGANGFIIHPDNSGTRWSGYIVDNLGGYHQIGSFVPSAINDMMHQYVISYDATTQVGSMFFDGVLVASQLFTGGGAFARTAGLISLELGRDFGLGGADRYGVGTLDEFALYPYALSASQVQNHYLSMVPEPASLSLLGLGLAGLVAKRRRRR